VFKQWVLELLVKNKSIASIKNDLVPLLLECQYREKVCKREGIASIQDLHSNDIFEKARGLSLTKNHLPNVRICVEVFKNY
jgi:translation initiation factor eIF-2B subunit gamma